MINNSYRSEWDAETLMEAERIKNNPNRLNSAQKAASRMVDKKEEELKAMKSVGRSGGSGDREEQNSGTAGNPKSDGSSSKSIPTGKSSDFGIFKRII